jgi:hypothetical protein
METTIPFAGFYYSFHDSALDHALEMAVSDDQGNVISQSLFDLAFDAIDWKEVHQKYAELYCKQFSSHYGIKVKFALLSSPKFYNFQTDRIFAEIELAEVERLFAAVDRKDLERVVKERFTSCDGFISHYSNDLEDWGADLSAWDHNQVGTLIQAYVEAEGDHNQFEVEAGDWEIADRALSEGIKDQRAFDIAFYLRRREYRNSSKGF